MSQANRQLIQELYDAFARGDAGAVLAGFHPEIRWLEAEHVGYDDRNPYHGPGQVGEGVFGRIMAEWDGFRVGPHQLVAEGDVVVALGRYTGRYRATGRILDAQFVHVWTISNGRVTAFQQYADTAQFGEVMGRLQPAIPLSA